MTLLPKVQAAIEAAAPFQTEDAAFAIKRKRIVLGHKTGLGKTFISLLAWAQWQGISTALIVGTGASVNTWRRILTQWGGATNIKVMRGAKDPEWDLLRKKVPGIYLCTFATLRILIGEVPKPKHVPVDLLILDELHKALRNRNETYKSVKRIDSTYFIGCTATWASKGPQDLWPILNYIDPGLFPSYWKFVDTWCFVNDASFGKEIIGARNADKLKELMRLRYYRTRSWKEVGNQFRAGDSIEPVVRRTELLPMSDVQAVLYNGMRSKMEARHGSEYVLAQNSLDQMTRCLQLALSPQILHPTWPVGGLVEWLWEQIESLSSVVIFVPFKPLVQICAKYFRDSGYLGQQYFLHGGVTPDDCDTTIKEWKRTKGIIFCTISYAQSFDLSSTDYAYFLGFDWDPNNNIQAEGRLRRFDTDFTEPCLATYMVAINSYYENVRDVVNGKVYTVQQVLQGYGS